MATCPGLYANGRARELNAYGGGINSSGEPDGNWSCKELVLQEGVRLRM